MTRKYCRRNIIQSAVIKSESLGMFRRNTLEIKFVIKNVINLSRSNLS